MGAFESNGRNLAIACVISLLSISWLTNAYSRDAGAQAGVTEVLNMQAEAWNRGDLDKFMTGYKHSPDTSYVSGADEVWGYETLLRRYENRYGSSRDTMGKLSFSDLKIYDLGRKNALCIGHWHLDRKDKPAVEGVYSLIFERTATGWKIIHDHTSVTESKS